MTTLPKVSIIILNYNEPTLTLACLRSLKKVTYKKVEIILVDNGSIENISKIVRKKFPYVLFIRNKKNMGYAEGNNIGFNRASGELVLFLNNDTKVDKNFLTPLVKKLMSSSQIAGVQPKILQMPRKEYIDSVGSYFINTGFLYHFGHNKKDQQKYNKEMEIFTMKGACMLFKRSVLQKTGLFDPNYFAYFEETDLCQRIWLAGYRIMVVPSVSIYHMGGQTSKSLQNTFIQFHSYKNRIFTYCKNLQMQTLIKILPVHIFLCEIISLVNIFTGKLHLAIAIQRAIFWNIVSVKEITKQRKKIAILRKVKDNDYLPSLTRHVKYNYYYHLFVTSLAGFQDENV